MQTYSNEKAVYSVDMMLAYLNTHKHPVVKLPMSDFTWQLEQDVWGGWSPADVLKRMDGKKWAMNANRIRHADLSYPVIVTGEHVLVDGYHRVAKAFQHGDTHVKAYVFDAALLRKFIIDKELVHRKASLTMEIWQILELYAKRFC